MYKRQVRHHLTDQGVDAGAQTGSHNARDQGDKDIAEGLEQLLDLALLLSLIHISKAFWYGFARSVPATVHFVQFAGANTHHILEACFKGAGHALAEAVRIDAAHRDEIPSTKGLLV